MTHHLTGALRTAAADAISVLRRETYVDVFRGLLIAHMALDHASLMFNSGRAAEELAAGAAPAFGDLLQFLTRFSGVPVAPAFFFMAGFMVAMTSTARAGRGVAEADITRRLVIRGLVLIGADALIMGLPRALMGFYSFMVLSSIGVALIALAYLRRLPPRYLLVGALAVLALHPLLDVSALPTALRAILYEPVRSGVVRSLYPIIPWGAIVVVGYVVGRDTALHGPNVRRWLLLAGVSAALFFVVRLPGGYGNAYDYDSMASHAFWTFAKYPPDLAFLTFAFTFIFMGLALLASIARERTPVWLKPFEIYGRVPFFFYIVHFYVLGVAQALIRTSFGLLATYFIWLALLAVMLWPCAWYYSKKRERPNFITRYL
jgi:uncharacterized membrane protein